MHISLKVSGLTKCILLHDYQSTTDGRIIAPKGSPLHQSIVLSTKQERITGHQFAHDIIVEMGDNVSIGPHLLNVGSYLHKLHKDQCNSWVLASVRAGNTASNGIRTFYDEFDIDDNDWSMETTHRTWMRYCKSLDDRITDGPIRMSRTEALKPGRSIGLRNAMARRMSLPQIDVSVLSRIVGDNLRCFALTNDRWDQHLYKCLKVYTMYDIGYRNEDITTILDIEWYNVSKMRSKWENRIKYDAALAESYRKNIDEWLASLSHERTQLCK